MNPLRCFNQSLFRKKFTDNSSYEEAIPHLISLQQESYKRFLQSDIESEQRDSIGIQSVFESFFPPF